MPPRSRLLLLALAALPAASCAPLGFGDEDSPEKPRSLEQVLIDARPGTAPDPGEEADPEPVRDTSLRVVDERPPALEGDPPAESSPAVLPPPEDPGSESIRTVAVVNDQTLTSLQVERMALTMAAQRRRAGMPVTPSDLDGLRQLAFRDMVLDMLFREGFRLSGMDESILDRIVADEVQRAIERAGSISAYTDQLAQAGRTIEDETQAMRRYFTSLLFLRVEQGIMPSSKGKGAKARLYVRPSEIVRYYEEHKDLYQREFRVSSRMILLREKPGEAPAEERIRELAGKIGSGAIAFAEAARRFSDYKASVGGSLGWVDPDGTSLPLQKPIRDFLRTARPGQMSAPIPVTNAWVLALAEDVREAGMAPFEEVQFEIAGKLMEAHRMDLLRETLNRLRKRSYIWGPGVEEALDSAFPETAPSEEEQEF